MNIVRLSITSIFAISLVSCSASDYSNQTNRHGVGAHQYIPAVDVEQSGRTSEEYAADLATCRGIAANRQETASRQAQQNVEADATEAGVGGAVAGAVVGTYGRAVERRTGDDLGVFSDPTESAAAGAGIGLLSSIIGQSRRRGQRVSAETRKTLLSCLENRGYVVLEDF